MENPAETNLQKTHTISKHSRKTTMKKKTNHKFMPFSCLAIKYFCTLNIVPFRWNDTTTTFTTCHLPSWRRIQYMNALCFIFIDICYVISRIYYLGARYYHWKDESIKLEEIVILFSLIGPKTMALLFSLTILVNADDIMEFSNEALNIAAGKKIVRDSVTVKVLALAFLLRTIQLVWVSIVKPNKSQFWYSALPQNLKTTVTFWIHFYFTLQASLMQFVVVFFMIILIVYYVSLDVVLTTKRNLTISGKLRTYRQAQLLSIHYQSFFAPIITVVRAYCPIISVVHSYGSIRHYSSMDSRAYINLPMSLFITIIFAHSIYSRIGDQPKIFERGQKLLFAPSVNSRTCQNDITRKCHKSCKAISLLGIQKIFFPQILKFIVFSTTRLLIATD